ncbi:MAG: hypothetical protein GOU97_04060 [Nanoarchaeota archaeon]|nr:hypothetical protein [Nanoarchaeota archaeon]
MDAVTAINEIMDDSTLPRTVRECLDKVRTTLNKEEDWEATKDEVIQMLEKVTRDPNMPTYTRTQIWSIVTTLELAPNQ